MKEQKGEADRISKRQIKSLELLTKVAIEESKIEAKEGETALKLLTRITEMEDKDKRERELTTAKLITDSAVKAEKGGGD